MREILFRAKRMKDKIWVEGSLLVLDADSGYYFITQPYKSASTLPVKDLIYNHTHLVDPKTVCQFTGMIDSNGNKIWEHDLIKFEDTGEEGYEYKEGYEFTNIAMVCFFNGRWELDNFADDEGGMKETMEDGYHSEFIGVFRSSEVVGNIFDNMELLKGGGGDE